MNRLLATRIAAFFLLATLLGCSREQSSLHGQLCNIYSSVNEQGVEDLSEREGVLAATIQSELPDFFNEHYVNLVQVDWAQRADTLDRLLSALNESKSSGLCSPIVVYYQR